MSVMVRHDAVLNVEIRSGRQVIDRSQTTADLLDAHLTVLSIIWNAASVSGGVRWAHPVTGEPISKPKLHYWLDNPERDTLVDGALCTCERCMKEDA